MLKRERLAGLKAYEPGEQMPGAVKLNSNENPYPPSEKVISQVSGAANEKMRLYPDPTYMELRLKIAEKWNTTFDRIVVGNGSDEVLDLVAKSFCEPSDTMAYISPSFSMFKIIAGIYGKPVEVELGPEFALPVNEICSLNPSLIFICSPNNPTGNAYSSESIEKICSSVSGMVLVDEAYGDFAGESMIPLVSRHNNLIVSRTFSKAYALAGMRVGYSVSSPETADILNKIRAPWNVSYLSFVAAKASLEDENYYQQVVKQIVSDRESLYASLKELGLKVYPSKANFIYFETENAEKVYLKLKRKGVLVRYFSGNERLKNGLRVSVGRPEENSKFLEALKDALR